MNLITSTFLLYLPLPPTLPFLHHNQPSISITPAPPTPSFFLHYYDQSQKKPQLHHHYFLQKSILPINYHDLSSSIYDQGLIFSVTTPIISSLSNFNTFSPLILAASRYSFHFSTSSSALVRMFCTSEKKRKRENRGNGNDRKTKRETKELHD